MPWHLESDNPNCAGWAVVQDSNGKVMGCHVSKSKAQAQLAALNINAKEAGMSTTEEHWRPPRDELVRSAAETVFEDDGGRAKMRGHFAVFNEWTEIDSVFEGHFMERIAPGAFKKTFQSPQRERIRVLLNHGRDPELGDKPIGEVESLEEDGVGARYVVDLFDGVPPLVREGIERGQYGASFRFRVMQEQFDPHPEISDHNPEGLPERTVKEAHTFEFGPTPFGAYDGATAGMRSMTDDYLRGRGLTLGDIPTADKQPEQGQAEVTPAEAPQGQPAGTSEPQPQKGADMSVDISRFDSLELLASRDAELVARIQYLNTEHAGQEFKPDVQKEWDEILEEREAIANKQAHLREREVYLAEIARKTIPNGNGSQALSVDTERRYDPPNVVKPPENIFDLDSYRQQSRSVEDEARLLRDGALRAVEIASFDEYPVAEATIKETVHRLIRRKVNPESGDFVDGSAVARRILVTGSPEYLRAFGKYGMGRFMEPHEARVLDRGMALERAPLTLSTTGLPVPYQLDPTIIPISNFSVNPFRAIARVVQTTVNNWRGATAAAITAAYATEPTEASDNTPTLAQPSITANRAQAFVPLSFEVSQDWPEVQAEMAKLVADAKDDLEATKFTLGSGTNEPKGIITATTGVLTITTTTGAFVVADLYKLEESLAPRFRPRASIIGNRFVMNKVRQFDTSGGSGVWLDVPGLSQQLDNQVPTPGNVRQRILGYPTYEDSAMDAALTTGSEILVMGDFSYFIIVDRIGMSAEVIPHLFGGSGTTHYPTGQRGLYFFWRNGSDVAAAAAFKTLQT